MATPKSKKLQEEEAGTPERTEAPSAIAVAVPEPEGPIQVREVKCLNDFVAILLFEIESSVVMPDADSKYKNEGLVVGVGPGISDGAGGRLECQVEVGDVVMFGERNVIASIASDSPPYAGRKVAIVSDRNLICKLHKQVDWVPVEDV